MKLYGQLLHGSAMVAGDKLSGWDHLLIDILDSAYRKISNIRRIQIPKLKWFSSRLAVDFAQSIEAMC